MMANLWPAGQTLTHSGFLNDTHVDSYKFIIMYIKEFQVFFEFLFSKNVKKITSVRLELKREKQMHNCVLWRIYDLVMYTYRYYRCFKS